MNQNTMIGILIPFAGTVLGSAMVIFYEKRNEQGDWKSCCSGLLPA